MLFYKCQHSLNPLPSSQLKIRGYGDFKILNNEWLKNLHMNGWVKHNGEELGVGRSKNGSGGCNPFQSNFGATKDT